MTTFNYARSVKSKLLNVSRAEKLINQVVLTRYFHERLLYRLSKSRYSKNFILKGGSLIYAHEQHKARPTLDIDFLGMNIGRDFDTIRETFKEICEIDCSDDGVIFHTENIRLEEINIEASYNGVRLFVDVSLDSAKQTLSMDVGFGDVVVPEPIEMSYPVIINKMPSFNVIAYSLETVVAEKVHAMVYRSTENSRMKDFYDVYMIITTKEINDNDLKEAIIATFENRGTELSRNYKFFEESFALEPYRNTMWNSYLKRIRYNGALPFNTVWQTIVDKICIGL